MNGTADGRPKTYRRFHSAHRLGSLSHEKVCSLDSWPSRGMTYMIHWITFEMRAKISKGAHGVDRISRKHLQVCKYRWPEWRTGLFHRSQYTLWDENGRGEVGGRQLLVFPHALFFRLDQPLLLKVKGLYKLWMIIHHVMMPSWRRWNDPAHIVQPSLFTPLHRWCTSEAETQEAKIGVKSKKEWRVKSLVIISLLLLSCQSELPDLTSVPICYLLWFCLTV